MTTSDGDDPAMHDVCAAFAAELCDRLRRGVKSDQERERIPHVTIAAASEQYLALQGQEGGSDES